MTGDTDTCNSRQKFDSVLCDGRHSVTVDNVSSPAFTTLEMITHEQYCIVSFFIVSSFNFLTCNNEVESLRSASTCRPTVLWHRFSAPPPYIIDLSNIFNVSFVKRRDNARKTIKCIHN